MIIAEVVETKKAFKSGQKDDQGNPLPLGSIEVRIGSHQSNLGQVRNIYARPATFQRRIPLIGEQVWLITAPVNDWSTTGIKGVGYLYFNPINATDDLVLHAFPTLWKRQGMASPTGTTGQRKADKKEWGYTFEQKPKKVENLQPFDGDDLFEGRFGQSIRFGSTVKGDMSVYEKKPTWDGAGSGDPILIFRVKKPSGGTVQQQTGNGFFQSNNKYTIEDLKEDESSIYITTNQKLKNFKAGFDKNQEAKKLGQFSGKSQIAVDSGRVVLNAKEDMLLLIGKEKSILTGKKVILQSDKYNVDLDELMDFLKKWLGEDVKLAQGSSMYATPAGPTGPATSMAQYTQLQASDFNKFKQP